MKKIGLVLLTLLMILCITGCAEKKMVGDNLVVGCSSEWSEWYTPEANKENQTFNVAVAYLGNKAVGDEYTCSLDIEFQGVHGGEGFGFRTQGAVDKEWGRGNVWDSKIVRLTEAPDVGIYTYTATNKITEKNVDAVAFNIGFRCDYWNSGAFRVRKIKVEKGVEATSWVQSTYDIGDGVNLAIGSSSEWSDWFTPEADKNNMTFNPFYAVLGEKRIGDAYTCSLEVEFKDVKATSLDNEEHKFRFISQGSVDKSWELGNIWNGSLVKLIEAPEDGVYKYTATTRITEKNVAAGRFNLGFRCDFWNSGSFRVRNIKVEKGTEATGWVQSTYDIGDGVNLAVGSSSEWSEWFTPEADKNNETFNLFYAVLGEKSIGDAYTCSLEVEFKDVKATSLDNEEHKFRFISQGSVDKSWELGNIWNGSLVKLIEAPEDGVYKYTATTRITEKNVAAERFNLGFRCDFWNTGSFRVRNVKVEKGITATEWTKPVGN